MCDAVNVMPYASDAERGALWTMISRDDMPRAETLLRQWKRGTFQGHPVHSQQIFVTPDDVCRLRERGIKVWTFIQKPGDAVFIPAGVGHQVKHSYHRVLELQLKPCQVTNYCSCIKIAVDFVAPCNVMHSGKISEELRQHRLDVYDEEDDDPAEDVLNLASMCWWFFVRSQTSVYSRSRSDPASNPWVSHYSAAPRSLQVPVRKHERQ